MERYQNPNDELNSPKYRSGKKCIAIGCRDEAGTAWSPYWCQKHNAQRMDIVGKSMAAIELKMREPKDPK